MLSNTLSIVNLKPVDSVVSEILSAQDGQFVNWLAFSFILFFAGLLGIIFNNQNFLVTMMCVELMYLGAISSFVLYGTVMHDEQVSSYGLFFLILAACESAVGLGILIVLYRFGRSIEFSDYEELGG